MSNPAFSCLLALVAVAACGCKSFLQPTAQARHSAYYRHQKVFIGDPDLALHQTYVVFSADFRNLSPRYDSETRRIVFDATNKMNGGCGLAVALSTDGYLLTASHVLGTTNFTSYVCGSFEGKIDIRPARVIFRHGPDPRADLALLKVSGKLTEPVEFGDLPKVGETVFAVVNYRLPTKAREGFDFDIDFTAGKVREVVDDPSGSSVREVVTNVPLWEGDSGGPLLSRNGRLVGIARQLDFQWHGVHWNYRRISSFPDKQFIQHAVAEDRAAGAGR